MRGFDYRDGVLHCEGVSLADIAAGHPTPFYLYDHETFISRFHGLQEAFKEISPLICFSVKANSNLNVLRALVKEGAGLDIVSGGELYRALKAGCPPEKIVYAGVGKTEQEIGDALRKNILFFNVESIPELIMINSVAGRLRKKARVAIRLNPDVKPDTHDYITTGSAENKFGVDFNTAEGIFDNANKYPNVDLEGVHVHIGSQITETAPFRDAVKKVLDFVDESGIKINWLNLGGGVGITYNKEKALTPAEFAAAVIPLVKNRSSRIILEPGRFIAASAGVLVCKVLYIKKGATGKRFAIVDAAMNDLIRPSLYEAYHEVRPVISRTADLHKYDVVGPVCESGDYLALDREFPELIPGEYLSIMDAGAYGFTMTSNYNSRPRPAELIVIGDRVRIIRAAETRSDLVRGEKILKELL